MLKLTVSVPQERDQTGIAELSDGLRTVAEDAAVATSDATVAKRHGNAKLDPLRPAGHPPFGRYELTSRGPTPQDAESEYGHTLLLFEPKSGPALEAESFGRLGLLVYSGAPGRDMYLRRTQGGVRLSVVAMKALLDRIADDTEVELHIEALQPRPWWAFWRKRRLLASLSKDPPRFATPPLDESSLAAELLRKAVRPARAVRDDDDRFLRRDTESRTSSREAAEFRGGGGSGGGGGASGAWADSPAAGRGPGVDAAGRIIGAAGVAALAASVAAAASKPPSSESLNDTRINGPTDTVSDTDSGGTSGTFDTQTSTSY